MTDDEYVERLVSEESLKRYLETEPGAADRVAVTYHQQGHSNETLFVTWGGRKLVLRRPPSGETAAMAHDMLRKIG